MTFRILIFCIFFASTLLHAQESDTIFVYEEVTVHDTIYLQDHISLKIPLQPNDLPKAKKEADTNNFEFGVSAISGIKENSFFKSLNKNNNIGFGGGIWIKKSLSNNLLSFSASANYLSYSKTFEIDAANEDSDLNGYYFTEENEPVLFQKLNNQHFEITIPVKVYFNFLPNFSPYFGAFGNLQKYEMEFLVPENFFLDKLSEFKTQTFNLGYIGGFQYNVNKWSIFVEYQQQDFQNLIFASSDTGNLEFQFSKGYADKKLLLGINYSFSK